MVVEILALPLQLLVAQLIQAAVEAVVVLK
jgi:hypothetical protein